MAFARALWAAMLALATLHGPVQAQTWAQGKSAYIDTVGPARPTDLAAQLSWPSKTRLSGPTTRYAHDILGGIPRWTDLSVWALACSACRNGSEGNTVRLPETLVFEDAGARLWDVTGDGRPEIVVVESHLNKGARLAVWSYDQRLTRIATTPHIGQPNRWLAPFGVGDFNGDGRPDIAYVDRPHLAREFVIVTLKGDRLVELARLSGVTNHRIGDTAISGGVRNCGQGAEAILANADWSKTVAVAMQNGKLTARALAGYSRRNLSRALACKL